MVRARVVGAVLGGLVLGIADGRVEADGKVIYEAKDLKVGLFENPSAAMASWCRSTFCASRSAPRWTNARADPFLPPVSVAWPRH